jgi:hypothetical protein
MHSAHCVCGEILLALCATGEVLPRETVTDIPALLTRQSHQSPERLPPTLSVVSSGVMRGVLRRCLVTFLALAFWGAMLERSALPFAPGSPCPMSAAGQVEHSAGGSHSQRHGHHHHGTKDQQPVSQQDTKCFCGCILGSSVLPGTPSTETSFAITSISFTPDLQMFCGHFLLLDPGIPKRTA